MKRYVDEPRFGKPAGVTDGPRRTVALKRPIVRVAEATDEVIEVVHVDRSRRGTWNPPAPNHCTVCGLWRRKGPDGRPWTWWAKDVCTCSGWGEPYDTLASYFAAYSEAIDAGDLARANDCWVTFWVYAQQEGPPVQ